jgi:hypothetical protein
MWVNDLPEMATIRRVVMSRGASLRGIGLLFLLTTPGFASEKAVKEFVESRQATAGQILPLADASMKKAIPDRTLFSLRFRQYPVGIEPPEGFSSSNVLSVDAAGKVTLLPTNKELQAFARETLRAREADQGKLAVKAWLLLRSELVQDGFYKFQVLEESLNTAREGENLRAGGRLIVMQGGNGEIAVDLVFDAGGKLIDVREKVQIREGPRPICQASKLLDADPLVRKICEADLLIMGRAAREYLMEQRATAPPALQAEIDRVWKRIERDER